MDWTSQEQARRRQPIGSFSLVNEHLRDCCVLGPGLDTELQL